MKFKIRYILGVGCLGLMCSCNDMDLNTTTQESDQEISRFLETVGAVYAGAEGDDIEIPIENPNDHTDNFEAADFLQDTFTRDVTGGRIDILYFSQLVSGKLEPFKGVTSDVYTDNMPEDMREKFEDGYPNVYKYYYNKKYESGWEDDPGGYNFFPENTDAKMNWDHIKYWGLNNTGYALYALYYPYNNELPYDESGNLDFCVQEDQSTKEAIRKSNFLAAYHSSSKSGQRLKFRLFHLSAYIKVTLYIPVFNPHDTIINASGKKVEVRTGFPADALQSAEVRDVYNHFRINWYGGRSSDTAPLTVLDTNNPRTNIQMYIPGAEDYEETEGFPPVVRIYVPDFVRDYQERELPEYDDCYKVTLHALIPGGQDYASDYPEPALAGKTWTDTNFLKFDLRQNVGDVPKRYVFNGESGSGLVNLGRIDIGQGKLQHLNLYLPRYGAQAVLLNATVQDWEQWYNDNMGLRQEDPIENPNTDPDPEPGTDD